MDKIWQFFKRLIALVGTLIDALYDASENDPPNWLIYCSAILGIFLVEYGYYTSSDKGRLLYIFLLVPVGAIIGIIILNILRETPALLAMLIISSIGGGILYCIAMLIQLLENTIIWVK